MQRREEEVAGAVAGEDAARAVGAVRRGREPEDQDPRARVAEARGSAAPSRSRPRRPRAARARPARARPRAAGSAGTRRPRARGRRAARADHRTPTEPRRRGASRGAGRLPGPCTAVPLAAESPQPRADVPPAAACERVRPRRDRGEHGVRHRGGEPRPASNFEGRNPPPPASVVDRQLSERNLNDETPVLERYWVWVKGVAHGDFGKTWNGDSVNAEMGRRIGVSARLLFVATLVGGLLGVLVGAWGAIRQYRLSDHVFTISSFVIIATPVFVLAILLQILAVGFNDAVGAKVFKYTGEFTPGLEGGFFVQAVDRVQHLFLPSLVLILGQIAIYSRYQRNAMLDVLGSDYVRTAQAKGLRRRTALTKHALRIALIPLVTFFAYDLAAPASSARRSPRRSSAGTGWASGSSTR